MAMLLALHFIPDEQPFHFLSPFDLESNRSVEHNCSPLSSEPIYLTSTDNSTAGPCKDPNHLLDITHIPFEPEISYL